MPNVISDNPAAAAAVAFFVAFIAALTQFGVALTQGQQASLVGLFVAGLALFLLLFKTTVAKTPSSTSAGLQTPPPGTVLVTTAAANKPAPVPAGSVVAGPTP